MNKDITIIIPARDEENSLKLLLKKFKALKKLYNEIIIVDGRSKDNTRLIAKKFKCKVIKQKGLGYGDAIIKGVKAVNTKYFIIFDVSGTKDFTKNKWDGKNVLLFGSEGFGLKTKTLSNSDFKFKVRMNKNIESLNISNTVSVVCHHIFQVTKQ